MSEKKPVSLGLALIPLIFLVLQLMANIALYGDDSLSGANQLALLCAAGVAAIIGIRLKYSWTEMMAGMIKSISSVMSSIFILLLIGSLAGTWLISGVIPGMIYYGLEVLSPSIFLVACCIITAMVSLATGSSWSTIATVGIALLGIGQALGFSSAMVAGAIISGAYFGDKISPLSDTTNLAPAMAGTDLITHIKYMLYTTAPSFSIALIIFLFLGLGAEGNTVGDVESIQAILLDKFNISPLIVLVPALVIFLIVKKVAPVPTLLIGALFGGLYAVIFQPQIITELGNSDMDFLSNAYMVVVNAMTSDIQIVSGNEMIDKLLGTGGMYGMLNTVWLVLCAMIFGGVMETIGMLERISEAFLRSAKTTFGLVLATTGTCLGFNVTASDQYLAIVVPGRMFADAYRKRGLAPENLSRTLEDAGTVTSVLVPWNTCGATQSAILGVPTLAYLPYCFFNIISPFMTITFALFRIKIRALKTGEGGEVRVQI